MGEWSGWCMYMALLFSSIPGALVVAQMHIAPWTYIHRMALALGV